MAAGNHDHGKGYNANSQSRKRYLDGVAAAPADVLDVVRPDVSP